MNRLTFILVAILAFSVSAFAQPSAKDTTEITEGVIVVKKQIQKTSPPNGGGSTGSLPNDFHDRYIITPPAQIVPFVKVEYSLFLSSVKEVPVIREANGQEFRDKVPVFDSAVYKRQQVQPVYPQKTSSLARYFSENITYKYKPSDSLRSDTLVVGLWITSTGKVKWAEADTTYANAMPRELMIELARSANGLREWGWGKGGGFNTKRRFLKPSQFVSESYYCELYVILSGKPLTVEQKTTGVKYAPFDIPLNSPPSDVEHRNSLEKNKKVN